MSTRLSRRNLSIFPCRSADTLGWLICSSSAAPTIGLHSGRDLWGKGVLDFEWDPKKARAMTPRGADETAFLNRSKCPIHVSPVPDFDDVHDQLVLFDSIDDTVLALANPVALASGQFL
jgi:hypothetical protein